MRINILLIIEADIATTQLIERVLLSCKNHGVFYTKRYLSALSLDDFDASVIPLFIRCGDPSLKYWVTLLKRADHPYIYYIDDNFWQISGSSPLALYYQHSLIRDSLEYAISNSSLVLTNSFELEFFLKKFNEKTQVLPAFFDFSLIKDCKPQKSEEIRVGFAGSPSRVDDLGIITPIIDPILKKYPNIVFEFVGVKPRNINVNSRIRFFSHKSDYKEYIHFQVERNWKIGLAPLVDNPSNRCKTDNKYREYGACKIAGVYSKIPPYIDSVQDEVTGLLVDNTTDAWLNAIHRLINNQNELLMLGERAYYDVLNRYCVDKVALQWSEAISKINRKLLSNPVNALSNFSKLSFFERIYIKLYFIFTQIAITYHIGGLKLVLLKSFKMLKRIIFRYF